MAKNGQNRKNDPQNLVDDPKNIVSDFFLENGQKWSNSPSYHDKSDI